MNGGPIGLSVNAAHNVLVVLVRCWGDCKIKEFSSHGDSLRELTLPDDVIYPHHAIQTRNGEFIVSHGGPDAEVARVCKISADGRDVIKSYVDGDGYYWPAHLAVDNNEFVFVADHQYQSGMTLLSPTLDYMRQVVSSHDLKGTPYRLYLDIHRRRLYVADNEQWGDRIGRVVVFSV